MTQLAAVSGVAMLAPEGKRMVAETMYAKGQAFVIAAALLRRHGGYEYAVLHLLCQGVEVSLKGLLLLSNYDQYKPRLAKPFGHHLIPIANAATSEFGLHSLRPALRSELATLSTLYSKHWLRYGSGYDLLVSATTIQSQQVFRRTAAVFRLVRMKGFARAPVV
jgi:hypothetical protein